MNMFCYQCQEASKNIGCSRFGNCGKSPQVSTDQDLLIYLTKGLSELLIQAKRENLEICNKPVDRIVDNLFSTITNANFNSVNILDRVEETLKYKEAILSKLKNKEKLSEAALWLDRDFQTLINTGKIGVLSTEDEDIRSLRELITYGIKGIAAYISHARVLDRRDPEIENFVLEGLANSIDDNLSIEELLELSLKTGSFGVKAMALLDEANVSSYGSPEISKVNIGVSNRPGILISGHDLKDMEMLLEQTEGTGVDVYTHSEMLPANYYPKFKKYPHFIGNYGNAWWKQNEEFESFMGPILMTTNCIIPVKESYRDRIYTTGVVSYPGVKHIEADKSGYKDFTKIIQQAKLCKAPLEIEKGEIIGGFGHDQLFSLSDKIVEAVKSGDIKRFVVMAGCDGRQSSRDYYKNFAKALDNSSVILTAGCAKYRYNKLNLGDINGIPRVLDAGQCNDSYSLVLIALKLQEIFKLEDINDLPIIYNISWYEQKAVIVLLSLLYLGVKNIHLGPTLPAFLSSNVKDVLIEMFNISPISTVEEDLEKFI